MLEDIKRALGLTDDLYNTEISGFIESAKIDLKFGNVDEVTTTDALTKDAIIAFCCYMFYTIHGELDRANALKVAYDNLKTQMGFSSRYRDWGDNNV